MHTKRETAFLTVCMSDYSQGTGPKTSFAAVNAAHTNGLKALSRAFGEKQK